MPETSSSRPQPVDAATSAIYDSTARGGPITAPVHLWFTSPARLHLNDAQAKELPLHLIQLILTYLDDPGDLARITRTSRLLYYMTIPRLYENVILHSYSEIHYVDGRAEGYGSGSPFAMGLNTLVTRTFTDYVQLFRVVGYWREHDEDDYKQGRVPDNNMVLQIAMRAALDKMKNLTAFAWELDTKPLNTVYQGLMHKPSLTSLTLRCQTKRIPRPTTIVPPLPNLKTLIVYDIDPLCYPDDISVLLLSAKKLENLKLHYNPRMRDMAEESVDLMSLFRRCVTAKHRIPIKRFALYNLYTRFMADGFDHATDHDTIEEINIINSINSASPITVFLGDSWRLSANHPVPRNLKMMRVDATDKQGAVMLSKFRGLERMYIISNRPACGASSPNSAAAMPAAPPIATPTISNGDRSANDMPKIAEHQCRNLGSEYLASIQSNHYTMRHLLLLDHWQLSDDALFKLCQSCPDLEQLGFSCAFPPLESLRQIIALVPKLWAIRLLVRPGSELAKKIDSMEPEMHQFALATELWRPEYKNLKYFGVGDKLVYKLGGIHFSPKRQASSASVNDNSMNAERAGSMRKVEILSRESVKHVEIWGMDSTEFEAKFL